jgi:hypothetical protein
VSNKQRAGSKELRALLRAIEAAGGRTELGGQGHWKIYIGARFITTVSNSTSDWRSRRNAVMQLRRAGLDVRKIS